VRTLALAVTIFGLIGMAAAVSLRAGAPNLAVGAVAVAAAAYFGQHAGSGFAAPLGIVIGLAAAVGAVQGLVVVGLHVPGWAVSVGVTLALLAWIATQPVLTFADGYNAAPQAYWWFGTVAAVSVISGLVGIATPIRRAVGGFRPVVDPAKRRPVGPAVITFLATIASSIIAAVAGVLMISVDRSTPTSGSVMEITAVGLGVALLGGTSAFGRRGGIFGTMLAAVLLAVTLEYASHTEPGWSTAGFSAAMIGLGLVVTRLVEWFGRPAPAKAEEADEEWAPRVHAAGTSTTTATNGWAAVKPPTQTTVGGIWAGDDAWGSTPR
jgi:ribose/xylose/arabinose/galactoside ABC-type transport system permease subunit